MGRSNTGTGRWRAGGGGPVSDDGAACGLLLVISGPSGVGKTTITRAVERRVPGATFSVSVTTRPKTKADVEGVDYTFLDRPAFERMVEQGLLLEHAEVFGHGYGTPRAWVEERLARGGVVILEIDVQGAVQIRRAAPDAFSVFILPPDDQTLLTRLRARRREDEAAIQRRYGEARREIESARSSGVYDHFVVNDDLERATGEIVELVGRHRAGHARGR